MSGEVRKIAAQGAENGNELKMLRRELGLDGQHGRLPILETSMMRQEFERTKLEARVDMLESGKDESRGKAKLAGAALALLGGSAGGALIAVIAHIAGVH